jgi:hypothetical protein
MLVHARKTNAARFLVSLIALSDKLVEPVQRRAALALTPTSELDHYQPRPCGNRSDDGSARRRPAFGFVSHLVASKALASTF